MNPLTQVPSINRPLIVNKEWRSNLFLPELKRPTLTAKSPRSFRKQKAKIKDYAHRVEKTTGLK